jgi:hypothetical protein
LRMPVVASRRPKSSPAAAVTLFLLMLRSPDLS